MTREAAARAVRFTILLKFSGRGRTGAAGAALDAVTCSAVQSGDRGQSGECEQGGQCGDNGRRREGGAERILP
jgi:hypothetical protein